MNLDQIVQIVNEAFGVFKIVLEQDEADEELMIMVDCIQSDIVDVILGNTVPQPQQ